MKTTVQARLDPESQRVLARLVRETGWSSSKVVREAVKYLGSSHLAARARKITGLGEFDSGITDLGSNKKHLKGLGR